MDVILILLAGIMLGAINLGFFGLGYYIRSKKKDENVVELTQENLDSFKKISQWMYYGGGK